MRNIKIVILILLFTFWGTNFVFAAEDTSMADILNTVVKLLTRIWIIPASIAGSLMSNDFVYGSVINLDIHLWEVRNIMKNFANFTLGFLFLGIILRSFFSSQPASLLKNYLPKIVISGVLIQMSWFLIAVIIDLSIVATSAIASFPQTFFDNQDSFSDAAMTVQTSIPKSCTIDPTTSSSGNGVKYIECNYNESAGKGDNSYSFLPDANDISGPFYYLGFGVLRTQDYLISTATGEGDGAAEFTIGAIIQLILLIMFILPIVLLMVINLIRIFLIWMRVIFSPFLIIDMSFGGKIAQNSTYLKIGSILGLIFQPVAIVATLSLSLILIIGVNSHLQDRVSIDDTSGGSPAKKIIDCEGSDSCELNFSGSSITVAGNLFKELDAGDGPNIAERSGGSLGSIFVTLFTIFLLWSLIKIGSQTSEITKSLTQGVFKFAEQSAKAASIVPTGNGRVGVGAVEQGFTNLSNQTFRGLQSNQAGRIEGVVERAMGVEGTDISAGERHQLTDHGLGDKTKNKKFFSKLQDYAKKYEGKLNLRQSKELVDGLYEYFSSNENITKELIGEEDRNEKMSSKEKFKEYLQSSDRGAAKIRGYIKKGLNNDLEPQHLTESNPSSSGISAATSTAFLYADQ